MNVAFVGAESHFVYTRSSQFLIEALTRTLGPLKILSSDWIWVHLPLRRRWDLVVFFQHLPERWELDCMEADNVVLVPMYDNCPKDRASWEIYRDCKILCFCSALADLLSGFGLSVLTARYYPPVPDTGADWNGDGLRAFFWPRSPDLNWSHVRSLVEGTTWSRIHLHVTNNLGEVPLDLTEEEARRLPVTRSSWFSSPDEYARVLREHQVFFAPRRYEGIGMSFLEAMSIGMAVIAPDRATMNEYIRSGTSGYLYDPDAPVAPPWEQARAWGDEARRQCIRGREAWVRSIPEIRDFLLSQPSRAPAKPDPRRTRAILRAWPGYLRYRTWKVLLAVRSAVAPWIRRRGAKGS
jgi:hypothetical protein